MDFGSGFGCPSVLFLLFFFEHLAVWLSISPLLVLLIEQALLGKRKLAQQ